LVDVLTKFMNLKKVLREFKYLEETNKEKELLKWQNERNGCLIFHIFKAKVCL